MNERGNEIMRQNPGGICDGLQAPGARPLKLPDQIDTVSAPNPIIHRAGKIIL
jgi:hypothetical protein